MGTSTTDDAAARLGSPTAIVDRVIALVDEKRYAEADAAARELSYLGLVGGVAEPISFRVGALTDHWSEVRRQPALIALAALVRQQVSGDVRAMDEDLVQAARTVALQMSADPVRRVSDLALQALCLLLGSRTDEALAAARRASDLLLGLGRELTKIHKVRLTSSACDLAGMFMLVDEYTSAMRLWSWVRGRISDPSSPLLVQADVGLACAAEIAGSRMHVRPLGNTESEHDDAPGLWHAMRLAASAWAGLDDFAPTVAIARTREAIAMLPDPFALGPLVTVHVACLIAAGHPRWAVEFLDAADEQGLPAPDGSALRRMRLLARVIAHAAAGDAVAAEETERLLAGDAQLHALAHAYRLLWVGDSAGAVDAAARLTNPAVTLRYEAFVRLVSAAAFLREGQDAEALADLDRAGALSLSGTVRGVALLLPRRDVAGLAALVDARGTAELRRLLPDPGDIPLEAPSSVELKPRERQVLSLASAGLTNGEIADRLFLSPNTVKYHLAHAFRVLGVSTREDAIARAGRIGQLTDPARGL